MRRAGSIAAAVVAVVLCGQQAGLCRFDVDWGVSFDNGRAGHRDIADWLVRHKYYTNSYDARVFAETGYIGYKSTDPDTFYWSVPEFVNMEIVKQNAGFFGRNVLGYYTGSGEQKKLTSVFSGGETGAKLLEIDSAFGLYLNTPQKNYWFTALSENIYQAGPLKRIGGNAQALIYELVPNYQWLVAWEDLDATAAGTDRDYNDMYVMITAVPEPLSCLLFIMGGAALALKRRRANVA